MYRPLKRWNKRETYINDGGYVMVWVPEHPKNFRGWYYEHRMVVEKELGRVLETYIQVHHINQIKTDNHPRNLFACTHGEHRKAHRKRVVH